MKQALKNAKIIFKKKTFYNKINTTFAHDFICIQKRDKSAKTQIFNIHIHNDLTRIHICAMWWLWTWFCKSISIGKLQCYSILQF